MYLAIFFFKVHVFFIKKTHQKTIFLNVASWNWFSSSKDFLILIFFLWKSFKKRIFDHPIMCRITLITKQKYLGSIISNKELPR